MTIFSGSARIEGVHPLQFGYVRRKIRTQRRHGAAIVNPLVFYPWRAVDFLKVAGQWLALATRYQRILRRVLADKARANYMDEAMRASSPDGAETDNFVAVYADKIPHTYGAPTRPAAAAS